MPNASKVTQQEIDQTFSPADVPVGISAVLGTFKRGPVNDPSIIITGFPQFVKIFGGLVQGADDAVLVQRAIQRGSQLRVVNVRNYTDPTNAATLSATVPTLATTKQVKLNAVLITANLITVTINGTPIAQLFSGTSDNTFALLVKLIQQSAALAGIVSDCWYMGPGTNTFVITPQTGVVLTVACVVTAGVSQAGATVSSVNAIQNSTGTTLFALVPKYPGQDYNNLQISILPASNGNANYFDIHIDHLLEPALAETYPNLQIVGSPNVANSNYLSAITNGSQLVAPTYNDASGQSAPVRPVNMYLKFDNGTDGGAVLNTDYVGSPVAKTGVYALDPYDDFLQFGVVNAALDSDLTVIQGLSAYSDNREDCVHFAHIDNSYFPESSVTAFRDSTLIDSSYTGFYTGGVIITDSFTGNARGISEIGDVLGIAAYSQANFGAWYSFAGKKRGSILNALGVVNNYGLDSNYAGRNLLANHQVNCAIVDKTAQLSGNFTAQLDQSTLSYMNVRMMLLYLKRLLGPIFKSYIEEPNDPTTWVSIYNEVKPQLAALKTKRAIRDWSYQGDQFVTDVSQVTVNDPNDIDEGKYVVNLYVQDIVSLQQIGISIILTPSGVSFEDTLSQVGDSANN